MWPNAFTTCISRLAHGSKKVKIHIMVNPMPHSTAIDSPVMTQEQRQQTPRFATRQLGSDTHLQPLQAPFGTSSHETLSLLLCYRLGLNFASRSSRVKEHAFQHNDNTKA